MASRIFFLISSIFWSFSLSLNPLTWRIRICFTIVDLPDSPAPSNRRRWVARYTCLSFCSCLLIWLLIRFCVRLSSAPAACCESLLPKQPMAAREDHQHPAPFSAALGPHSGPVATVAVVVVIVSVALNFRTSKFILLLTKISACNPFLDTHRIESLFSHGSVDIRMSIRLGIMSSINQNTTTFTLHNWKISTTQLIQNLKYLTKMAPRYTMMIERERERDSKIHTHYTHASYFYFTNIKNSIDQWGRYALDVHNIKVYLKIEAGRFFNTVLSRILCRCFQKLHWYTLTVNRLFCDSYTENNYRGTLWQLCWHGVCQSTSAGGVNTCHWTPNARCCEHRTSKLNLQIEHVRQNWFSRPYFAVRGATFNLTLRKFQPLTHPRSKFKIYNCKK